MDQLRVGEHEQFFYANKYFGMQSAVCFDSTFPHFRVQVTAQYKNRRERMQSLMTQEFQKVGFPSVIYLLRKYDALDAEDIEQFVDKNLPPWQVSDDSCGSRPEPPNEITMFFVAVLSSGDQEGLAFRQMLRSDSSTSNVWLPRLVAAASTQWSFFVSRWSPELQQEEDQFGDIIFMPPDLQHDASGTSAEQLRFLVAFLRDFQFTWLVVTLQGAFVHLEAVFQTLARLRARTTVFGDWQSQSSQDGTHQSYWLNPVFFAMSQDVHHLLASNRVAQWLRTDLEGGMAAAMNAWLSSLRLQRVALNGVYDVSEVLLCPVDAVLLHPVTVDVFLQLSDAAMLGYPCTAFNSTG